MNFKLRSESQNGFDLGVLLDRICSLANENKIRINNKRHDEKKLYLSFTCPEWRNLAPQKYLDAKTFKSRLPIFNQDLEKLESQVKRQILEAAESELIASQLFVKLDAAPDGLTFTIEYDQFPDVKQAKQIGIYLFNYLESAFGNLSKDQKFYHSLG